MLELFFKKERQLEKLIYIYLENLGSIQSHFVKAIDICLDKGVCDDFCFFLEQTHKFESKADDLRQEINELMYGRALIPESREDIMSLLESIDRIPGSLEVILNIINTQRIVIPDFIRLDIRELIRISMESCDLMARQVDTMLNKREGVRGLLSDIDQKESQCDHIEQRIMGKPGNKHTYFGLIMVGADYPHGGSPMAAEERCRVLLNEALPILLTDHYPSREQVRRQ